MVILLGAFIVIASTLGGYIMSGGHIGALMHLSEFVIIGGAAGGALIVMSPRKVLMDILKKLMQAFKGSPYTAHSYEELLKALYELFVLGRRNGMIALEEHVTNPTSSSIFSKYPSFLKNHHAVEFLCDSLKPIVDGRVKPDQLSVLLDTELEAVEAEHHAPVNVLTKTADAMPGFGIVAAVLGIVVTMGAIAGPVEEIGHKVAAALVGTFLGIFLSYGFLNPLATNVEFINLGEMAYLRCIASAVTSFAKGMAPIMAVEVARRGLSSELKPGSEEMETMLKALNGPAK